jgi:hypothetical protein
MGEPVGMDVASRARALLQSSIDGCGPQMRLIVGLAVAAQDEALVDRLVAPGHPSTPGYNDPAYPLEGRVPRSV